MSINGEIERIQNNVSDALAATAEKGASVPEGATSDNLGALIRSIPTSGGTSINVTAEVGQTIVAKSVDENGKPTAWEAADYQPRTHWSETTEILPETNIPFVESIEGFRTEIYGQHLAIEDGKTYTVVYNGAAYTTSAVQTSEGEFALGNLGAVNDSFADTGEPFCIAISLGQYAEEDLNGDMTYGDFTEITVKSLEGSSTVTLSIGEEVVHKIPVKYLPDGTSGGTSELLNEHGFLKKEVLPPGYGYVEVNSETVYIYASELTVDENGFYNYSRRIPALRVGETYTVFYNGANYTCTAVGGSIIGETDDDIVLGNYGLVLGEEGTGEPFVLRVSGYRRYLSSGISAAIIPLDGEELSSDILISGLTITPYPSHPDYTGTSPLVVTCRHVDGFANRLQPDTDFSIILTAIKAGRIVVCIADGRVFSLKAYNDNSIEFDCIRIPSNAVASVKISNATLTITNGIEYASYTANTYTVPFTE